MIVMKLEYWEMVMVAGAGVARQVENCFKGRKPAHGAGSRLDWQINIEGCMGEYVIAKHLNLHWDGKGQFRGRDVDTFEVRTAMGFNRRLILHKEDDDHKPFFFVCGLNGIYHINGWILAADGKREEYWEQPKDKNGNPNGRPAYFVPTHKLRDPSEFDVNPARVAVYKQVSLA